MERSWKLKDTKQTKRMKLLAINDNYLNDGEMHKLLNSEILHKLVKKIRNSEVRLTSDLIYGKNSISEEEKFLENLDKYIEYVKNHYFIDYMEQLLIIEESLKSKYANILFSLKDFHSDNNYEEYHDSFRKMFFYNFYSNICFFSKMLEQNSYTRKLYDELKKYNYDNKNDMLLIEKKLSKVIISRNNNLYNAFVDHAMVIKESISFYMIQIEWIISDYYKKVRHNLLELLINEDYEISTDSISFYNLLMLMNHNNHPTRVLLEICNRENVYVFDGESNYVLEDKTKKDKNFDIYLGKSLSDKDKLSKNIKILNY